MIKRGSKVQWVGPRGAKHIGLVDSSFISQISETRLYYVTRLDGTFGARKLFERHQLTVVK